MQQPDDQPSFETALKAPLWDAAPLQTLASEVGKPVLAKLLSELESEIHQRMESLRPDALSPDRRTVEVNAHALKSVARSFGLPRLGECAFCLEYAAAEGGDLQEAALFLASEFAASLKALEELKSKFGLTDQT